MTRQIGPGWMPDVDQVISPNIMKGRAGLAIEAGCMHIMDGEYAESIEWLTSPKSGVSAHFGISLAGGITQMVNIFDTAYTNGLKWDAARKVWIDPEGNVVKPSWKRLRPPVNPNFQTFTIEHEGHKNQVWTPAMYEADRRILLYVQSQVPGLVFVPHDTLIGHNEISPVARPYCPGPGVDLAKIAASVTGEPDWRSEWGRADYDQVKTWGIFTRWKQEYLAGHTLGHALTGEQLLIDGWVYQIFEYGVIRWKQPNVTEIWR
jgi:hypothetical protein